MRESIGRSRQGPCGFRAAIIAAFVVLAGAVPGNALAQTNYPNKPIRLVVPQAAGSATDAVGRILGDEPAGGTPEEFGEIIRADSAKWGEVVRRSGARLD